LDPSSGWSVTFDLPLPLQHHNIIALNDTHVFLFGGFEGGRAWIGRNDVKEWVEVRPCPEIR